VGVDRLGKCVIRKYPTIICRLNIPWYRYTTVCRDVINCRQLLPKNSAVRIVCSALTDSLSLCVNDIICKFFAPGRGCHAAGIYIGVLLYADDLLLISSTCS